MRCSVLIVWVDFSFGGEEGESNESRYDEVVVLDGWFGVFWFECALIGDFGEVNFSDVESIRCVSENRAFGESPVKNVVELSGKGVVLFQKHFYSLIIISLSLSIFIFLS